MGKDDSLAVITLFLYNVYVRNGSARAAPDCGMFQVGDLVKISELGASATGWAIEAFENGSVFLIAEEPDRDKYWLWTVRVSDGKKYCLFGARTKKVG